jgi:hypothetical protein
MSESRQVNPMEILRYRQKLKRIDQTGIPECMKLLKTVR